MNGTTTAVPAPLMARMARRLRARALTALCLAVLGALAALLGLVGTGEHAPKPIAASDPQGYWFVASDGGIFSFGNAAFAGSTGALHLNQPIVGMAATPSGNGYWLVAADGGVFTFGDAQFFGSTGALHLNKPIVGMAPTPTGKGYWFVASDGGVFTFGDAQFFGSTGALPLNKPIVGMAATPTGNGYWLVASDGGVFTFGDAQFFGSTGALRLNKPIVGMAASPDGLGYWFVASDGGIFNFGDAGFFGSAGALPLFQPIVGMAATPSGSGYWLVAADGGIFTFGDAGFFGSIGGTRLNQPVVGMAASLLRGRPPAKLRFSVAPASIASTNPFSPAVQIEVLDAANQRVTSATNTITLGIGVNPGAGTLSGSLTRAASGGVVTFDAVSIDKAGAGYTLTATSPSLTGVTSAPFNVAVGPAHHLAFAQQPGTTNVAQVITPAMTVQVLDAGGNLVSGATNAVTLSMGNNPTGAVLGGTVTRNAVGGIATFNNITLDKPGQLYTLNAGAPGLVAATSNPFNVIGSATRLVYGVQPTNAEHGVAISPAITVQVQDAGGNVISNVNPAITLAIGTNPAAGTLSGTATRTAVNGVATFPGISIDNAGNGYTLTATAPPAASLTAATSSAFNVIGTATSLLFASQPIDTVAGTAITPAVTVHVKDALGNTVPSSTAPITVAIGTNPAGGVLSGTLTKNAVGGVATFNDLAIDKAASGYTLSASTAGLTGATSNTFAITPGAASVLAFTTQPVDAVSTNAITPAPAVAIRDALGNTVTSATSAITVAIGTNPSGGLLSGTATQNAVNGVATFAGLSIDKAGTGYTLIAASGTLTGATSNPFAISVGPANRLIFSVQPSTTPAATTIAPNPVIQILDAGGNLVTAATDPITISIGTNPAGGTLTGTLTRAAASGAATFNDLAINAAGAGYTLHAASGALTAADSGPFDILVGAPARLAFGAQPSNTTSTSAITPSPTVRVLDAGGNLVTSATDSITMSIGTNPGGGALAGTLTQAAVGGIATFPDLSIDKAATGYTLSGASGTLTSATSGAFNITVGPAVKLGVTQQPTDVAAGSALAPSPAVAVQDNGGNTITGATNSITLAIGTNPSGGVLSGTTTVPAVSGVATFPGLSIDKTGTGYTLTASATGLTGATSNPFAVNPGAPHHLLFNVGPSNTTGGTPISPAMKVRIFDSLGNFVNSAGTTNTVTLALDPTSPTGTLVGTLSVAAVAGEATFSNVAVNEANTGYKLRASSTGLTGVTSAPFDVAVGPISKLEFGQQPSNVVAAVAISPSPTVKIEDLGGNLVTAANNSIQMAIATNPPGTGAFIGSTTLVAAVNGVATFSNLKIDKVGTGYTIAASATGLTGATSNAFNVTAGPASQLGFLQQPTNAVAATAISPAITVQVQDAQGNLVSTATDAITLAIGTNPGGGTLSGTKTQSAVNGVATFAGLSIQKSGTGYTLTASATGLTGATSAAFNITAGPAAKLAFGTQPPATVNGGSVISPAITVEVRDANDNLVATATDQVTMAFGANPAAGTLSGTKIVNAVNGIATFSTLSVDRAGSGYSLNATAAGLTNALSSTFDVVVGPAAKLTFTVSPGSARSVDTLSNTVIEVQDLGGNTKTTDNSTQITVSIGTNAGCPSACGTLSTIPAGQPLTKTASGGQVSFGNLNINKTGVGYTLKATASGLTDGTSTAFDITPGPVNSVVFSTQPTNVTAGAVIAPPVAVTELDVNQNVKTDSTDSVVMTIGTNPGGGTLSGTTTQPVTNGVATFNDLSINKAGTGYKLHAATDEATPHTVDSGTFNVLVGPAALLSFTTQPVNTNGGEVIGGANGVKVSITDNQGNVTGSTATVSIAIGNNAGPGTLSGTLSKAAVAGVATFGDLKIDKAATGYTLVASSGTLPNVTSNAFNITVGPAAQLHFGTGPSDTRVSTTMAPNMTVRVTDLGGNTVSTNGTIVSLTANTCTLPCAVSGGTQTTSAGTATFTGFQINTAGTYTLTANTVPASLTPETTGQFNIYGNATQLAFSVQPANTVATQTIQPNVKVEVRDAGGRKVVDDNATNVAMTIGTNPSGGTLTGTTTVSAQSGVATFSNLHIDKVGTGYKLHAASGSLTAADSAVFNIASGAATKLAFGVQPGTTTAGTSVSPAVTVQVQDAGGNVVTSDTRAIGMAIGTNPSGGVLSGTTPVNAVNGVATFSNLSIDKSGAGYTLSTSASGLTGATSNPFTVNPASESKLAFGTQPSNTTGGVAISPAVTVRVLDAFDNLVTSSTASVTVAIGTNPGSGTLGGTLTRAASGGVATFNDLTVDKVGTGYTLTAVSGTLSGATSTAFNITVGPKAKLVFNTQPTTTAHGAVIPSFTIWITDAGGNLVNTATDCVQLRIKAGTGTGGAVLSGTTTRCASSGVVTFNDLSIDKVGTAYQLETFGSTGLTEATSTAFDIT